MEILLYDNGQPQAPQQLDNKLEIGRQEQDDIGQPLFELRKRKRREPADGRADWRIDIANPNGDRNISRRHVEIEPVSDQLVRVKNLSATNPIRCDDGTILAANSVRDFPIPVLLTIGEKSIRVQDPPEIKFAPRSTHESDRLSAPTMAPGTYMSAPPRVPSLKLGGTGETEPLVEWFQAVTRVLHSAANSTDFYQRAAQGVVELVGLDSGLILVLDEEKWQPVAAYVRGQETSRPHVARNRVPSQHVLNEMRRERSTIWQTPSIELGDDSGAVNSLRDVQTVIAAPILDRRGLVIGALYGDRMVQGVRTGSGISRLEAMLVETLACGVATGLARLEQEQAAVKAQVQFEQFFTPELSRQLAADPNMLEGRDAEVTLLFCDVRGFSRICESLSAEEAMQWIGSVMGVLSDCVSQQNGVLVDYIGDELLAMWGAPGEQPDHAQRACRAALDMLAAMPTLNEQWRARLPEAIRVGIGINTGIAQVGNTGSHRKFKYGPLGNTVNLASRVQGASKYLKADLVVTAATHAKLGPEFNARRLCKVRVVNIKEPVELFELRRGDAQSWSELHRGYEQALTQFEAEDLRRACRTLGQLVAEYPYDGPSLLLMSRAVDSLVSDGKPFDSVWELPGK